jgi:uncharacterized membrane protein required for colicin V production
MKIFAAFSGFHVSRWLSAIFVAKFFSRRFLAKMQLYFPYKTVVRFSFEIFYSKVYQNLSKMFIMKVKFFVEKERELKWDYK